MEKFQAGDVVTIDKATGKITRLGRSLVDLSGFWWIFQRVGAGMESVSYQRTAKLFPFALTLDMIRLRCTKCKIIDLKKYIYLEGALVTRNRNN